MCRPVGNQGQSEMRGALVCCVAPRSRDVGGMAGRSRMSREAHVRSLWGAGGEIPPADSAVFGPSKLGTQCLDIQQVSPRNRTVSTLTAFNWILHWQKLSIRILGRMCFRQKISAIFRWTEGACLSISRSLIRLKANLTHGARALLRRSLHCRAWTRSR